MKIVYICIASHLQEYMNLSPPTNKGNVFATT